MNGRALCADKRFIKRLVFLFVQRAINIIIRLSAVISRLQKSPVKVNALRRDYRSGGVKKAKISSAKLLDFFRKSGRSQRPCGDDYNAVGDFGNFFPFKLDFAAGKNFFRYKSGKLIPVNGKRAACGNSRGFGALNAERAEQLHFGFQHTRRAAESEGFKRI